MEKKPDTTDDPHGNDWQESCMVFKPGRFYHAIGFVHVPCMGELGGDNLCLIWRYDDEPNTWNVTMRFRYYAGENTPAFDGGDTKNWYVYRGFKCDDVAKLRGEFEMITSFVSLSIWEKPKPVDWIMLDGNAEQANKILMETERSWLHKKTEPLGELNG